MPFQQAKRNLNMSTASRSTSMDALVADLERARAELQVVRDECDYLRHIVQTGLSSPVSTEHPASHQRKRLSDSADAVAGSRDVTISEPLRAAPDIPSTPKATVLEGISDARKPDTEDEIERLSEREAKDKLRVCALLRAMISLRVLIPSDRLSYHICLFQPPPFRISHFQPPLRVQYQSLHPALDPAQARATPRALLRSLTSSLPPRPPAHSPTSNAPSHLSSKPTN